VYYVYAHISNLTQEVFYIGKGSGNRAWQTGNRSRFWKNYAKKHGRTVELLHKEIEDEEEAFRLEIEAISSHRKIGQCKVNVSDGGDGVRVPVRWWGAKISLGLMGRKAKRGEESHSFKSFCSKEQLEKDYSTLDSVSIAEKYGVTAATVCHRLKLFGITKRLSGRRRRKVKCITDGKVFPSLASAAKHYGIFRENISKVLAGKYKHTGGKKFKLI
jgi:hypothetical protein